MGTPVALAFVFCQTDVFATNILLTWLKLYLVAARTPFRVALGITFMVLRHSSQSRRSIPSGRISVFSCLFFFCFGSGAAFPEVRVSLGAIRLHGFNLSY